MEDHRPDGVVIADVRSGGARLIERFGGVESGGGVEGSWELPESADDVLAIVEIEVGSPHPEIGFRSGELHYQVQLVTELIAGRVHISHKHVPPFFLVVLGEEPGGAERGVLTHFLESGLDNIGGVMRGIDLVKRHVLGVIRVSGPQGFAVGEVAQQDVVHPILAGLAALVHDQGELHHAYHLAKVAAIHDTGEEGVWRDLAGFHAFVGPLGRSKGDDVFALRRIEESKWERRAVFNF